MRGLLLLISLMCCGILQGCGNKGPLYLPDADASAVSADDTASQAEPLR